MYVTVESDGRVKIYNAADGENPTERGTYLFPTTNGAVYQHTLFNGGFNFVLNNGVSTPVYFADNEVFTNIQNPVELPNWDSYLAQENVVSVVWDDANIDIPLGRFVSLNLVDVEADGTVIRTNVTGTQGIVYRVIPRDPSLPILTQNIRALRRTIDPTPPLVDPSTNPDDYRDETAAFFTTSNRGELAMNWMITPTRRDVSNPAAPILGAEPGDTIEIAIQERPDIIVTAGVVRAYGSLLVAGNLRETDVNGRILRNLPGTIRTSDVAPPGNVPANWNPFRNGATQQMSLHSLQQVQYKTW